MTAPRAVLLGALAILAAAAAHRPLARSRSTKNAVHAAVRIHPFEGAFRVSLRREGEEIHAVVRGRTSEPVVVEVVPLDGSRLRLIGSRPGLSGEAVFRVVPAPDRNRVAGSFLVRAKAPSGFWDQEVVVAE